MAAAINATAITAIRAGNAGFGLAGGGFTIYYIVGVLQALLKLGILVPGKSKVAGASSGALSTAAVCSGLSGKQIEQQALSLAYACQKPGNCAGVLDAQVRALLKRTVPKNGFKKCSGKGYLSISMGEVFNSKNVIVGEYVSDADLISAGAASSFLPFHSANTGNTIFRGKPALDGGVTNNLPCPPKVAYCIRISLNPYSFKPADSLETLENMGAAQTDKGKNRFCKRGSSLATKVVYDKARIAAANKQKPFADIRPNVYTPLPFTRAEWERMKFTPACNTTLNYLIGLGYRDGMAWAGYTGVAKKP